MELIPELVSQLGIGADQAKGGAGLLFKLVQSKLGGDFSKIASALPEVTGLIQSAPQAGGAAQLLGGLAAKFGGGKGASLAGLASLAGGFSQLKLDPGMIGKFVPVILSFVQAKGGGELQALIAKVLK
ncbi:MAG TPA: hypothetical protein DCM68_03965 [Verrucomicrobia bacterium]|nr:hypothetical protein [Verrucomicrobiota bacterium]